MMTETVECTTERIDGKESPVTITRQRGYQLLEVCGRMVPVISVTIFDRPCCRTLCYTVAPSAPLEEVLDACKRRAQGIVAQALAEGRL